MVPSSRQCTVTNCCIKMSQTRRGQDPESCALWSRASGGTDAIARLQVMARRSRMTFCASYPLEFTRHLATAERRVWREACPREIGDQKRRTRGEDNHTQTKCNCGDPQGFVERRECAAKQRKNMQGSDAKIRRCGQNANTACTLFSYCNSVCVR